MTARVFFSKIRRIQLPIVVRWYFALLGNHTFSVIQSLDKLNSISPSIVNFGVLFSLDKRTRMYMSLSLKAI